MIDKSNTSSIGLSEEVVVSVKDCFESVGGGTADVPLMFLTGNLFFDLQNSNITAVLVQILVWCGLDMIYQTHPVTVGAIAMPRLVGLLQVQGKEVWSGAGVNTMEIKGGSGEEGFVEQSRRSDQSDSPLCLWQLEPLEDGENPLLKGHVTEEEEKEEQGEVEEQE